MRDTNEAASATPPVPDDARQKIAEEQQPAMRIEVADSLRGSHDLVSLANRELQIATRDRDGLIGRSEKGTLNVVVSKSSLRRALIIMDALLKALERRGHQVEAGPKAKILDVTVSFGISEHLETKREPCEEHDLDGPYDFGHSRFNSKKVPSGRLTLTINEGGSYWTNGCRHTWRDTDKKPLEKRLNQFVAGLVEMAARLKQFQEEQRKQEELRRQAELRRQEETRQLAEKRKLYKAEKARFEALLTQAENWRKSKLIRELIEAVRAAHSAGGPIDPSSKIAEWLEWAARHADRLDPLQVSPPSILDENLEEEERPQQTFRRW
jgi:hypothetical protein